MDEELLLELITDADEKVHFQLGELTGWETVIFQVADDDGEE